MLDLNAFLDRAERYADATGLAVSTVSRMVFNDGKRIRALREGATITTRRLERAQTRLTELEGKAMRGHAA